MLALASLSIAFWILIHPYRGLEHDSVLYTVLALARLHPAALGHDLFVRYGAQDHYTIFSPMFAAAILLALIGFQPVSRCACEGNNRALGGNMPPSCWPAGC